MIKDTLLTNKEVFKSVVESSTDLTVITNSEGINIYVSPQCKDVIGYDEDEIIGKLTPEFIHPDDMDRCKTAWAGVMAGESIQQFKYRIFDKKGKILWLSHSAKYTVSNDNIVHILNIIRNITEQKVLSDSEQKFRNIFESTNNLTVVSDLNGNFIETNPSVIKLLGYTQKEFVDLKYTELIHPDDLEKTINTLENNMLKGKRIVDFENRYRHRDGYFRWLSWSVKPVPEQNRIYAMAQDITRQKQAEEKHMIEHSFAECVIDTAQTIILVLDTQGLIVRYNRYLEDISGYRLEETRGKDWFTIFLPPGNHDKIRERFKEVVKDIQTRGNVNPIICKDGRQRYIDWYNTTLKDYKGNIIGLLAVGQDITERKKAEKELNQSQKMYAIGQLAGGIAHDFNNVLAGIIGYADMALDELTSNELLSLYMRNILTAGERAKHLINQILTFSCQGNEKKLPVNLRPVMKEVAELLKVSLPPSINLSVSIRKETCPVIADTEKVHEAVMNLSTNAIHAMDEKGELIISLQEEKTEDTRHGILGAIKPGFYSVIEVRDTGTGIDETLINRVFEPFYTTNKTGEGTGLGLSVVYGVMQSHNGNISVESCSGKGTIFKLFFPKSETMVTVMEEEIRKEPIKGHERILFVDDEELVKDMGTILLNSLGYKVSSTSNSLEALETIKKDPNSFDLLITDQAMPDMTGLELAHEIHKINSELPIVLCTGFSSKVSNEKIAAFGINAIFFKPLIKRDIAIKLREILDS
ncbi:MAG: PAS domain S-box protein [Chitinispirillia bacterium]|jgi:PAS domain S-box-containing protein